MVIRKGLPQDLTTLIKQLVAQRQIRMAITVLTVFFMRNWGYEEEEAASLTVKYFQKYYAPRANTQRKETTNAC